MRRRPADVNDCMSGVVSCPLAGALVGDENRGGPSAKPGFSLVR
jgi:hypothetical protein